MQDFEVDFHTPRKKYFTSLTMYIEGWIIKMFLVWIACVKFFRINPEFRILKLTFHRRKYINTLTMYIAGWIIKKCFWCGLHG